MCGNHSKNKNCSVFWISDKIKVSAYTGKRGLLKFEQGLTLEKVLYQRHFCGVFIIFVQTKRFFRLEEIATAVPSRLEGLIFGADDYAADIGAL